MLHGLLENAIYGGRIDNIFDGKASRVVVSIGGLRGAAGLRG